LSGVVVILPVMPEPNLHELLAVATEAAYVAGRRTLSYFNTGVAVDIKQDDTPVTIADREAEQIVRSILAKYFPSHTIVGEEQGESAGDPDYKWYVDPIDGTKSFIHGIPLYSVLIGCEIRGRVDVGVIYLPALDEMIAAAHGLGCSWNGRRAKVSSTDTLQQAMLLCTDLRMARDRSGVDVGVIYLPALDEMIAAAHGLGCSWNGRRAKVSSTDTLQQAMLLCTDLRMARDRSGAYDRLEKTTKLQRCAYDAYGYALVATGRADVIIDPVMNDWDCGPLPVIFREAGGRFSNWKGEETIHGGDAVATNGRLHHDTLKILQEP